MDFACIRSFESFSASRECINHPLYIVEELVLLHVMRTRVAVVAQVRNANTFLTPSKTGTLNY
ncbi:hypothetical protein [Synechococcus sp. M16CYN]|uniref:hypothetical protein n=1 Tax=Synechococcus sp. M16CYN TaxID=3103139 RepID=UPI0032472A9C